jgi:hypothetical protein
MEGKYRYSMIFTNVPHIHMFLTVPLNSAVSLILVITKHETTPGR